MLFPNIDQPLHRTNGEGGVQGNPGTCPSSFQQEETADGVHFRLESKYPDPRGSKNKERKEKCTELRWKTWGKEKRTKCDQYRGGSSRSSRGGEDATQGRRRGGGSEAVDDGGKGKRWRAPAGKREGGRMMQSRAGKRAWDRTPDLTSQWAPSLPRWLANPAQYDKPSNQSYLGSFVEGERLERKMQILDIEAGWVLLLVGHLLVPDKPPRETYRYNQANFP